MSKNPVRWVLLAGCIALAAVLILYFNNTTTPFGQRSPQFSELGGQFELQSYDGPVNLDDYAGQVVVMYFGFLSCPEICPASAAIMGAGFKQLDEQYGDQVKGLFVSVDPERDDLASLKRYAEYFDPRISGVTGSQEQLDAVTRKYGVYYDVVNMNSSELSYTIDHVSLFYIISPGGDLIDAMSHTTTPIELAARIQRALNAV